MSFVLPGQPIVLPKGPAPQLGQGTYVRDGQLRASLMGVPKFEGGVCALHPDSPLLLTSSVQTIAIPHVRPRAPQQDSIVLGTVVRLSPLQAVIAITVVDGVPLPHGEEFQGVIRTQDVRATEKDKIKIAECFRGGDVVRGVVVRHIRLCVDPPPIQFV